MSSFGEAFLDVHADVSPFKREIDELKALIAAQSVSLAVNVRQAGTAARAAAAANTTTTNTLTGDASGAIAADEAAAAAARASQNQQTDDARQAALARRAIAAAETAAYREEDRRQTEDRKAALAEQTAAVRAAAAEQRAAARADAAERTDLARAAAAAEKAIRDEQRVAARAAAAEQTALARAAAAADKAIRDEQVATARADDDLVSRVLRDSIANDLAAERAHAAEQRTLEAARVAEARAAADEIRRINRQTADQLNADLAAQVAAQRAADAAITASSRQAAQQQAADVRDARNAVIASQRDLDALVAQRGSSTLAQRRSGNAPSQNDIRAAADDATAAIRRLEDAQRAAGVAESDIGRIARKAADDIAGAMDDATKHTSTLGNAASDVSKKLSQLGLTGQARLIALGATFGAPLAIIGAFVAAAAAAGAAVAVFGAQSADELRTARLNFQSLGASANQAAVEVRSLEELASKGLTFANLEADTKTLGQLGINGKNAVDILSTLGDAFAKTGDVGKQLQTDIDNASVAIANLISSSGGVTLKNFSKDVENLKLPATAAQTFKELQKELGVTGKQLDDLIKKGKISGAQVAAAAVTVAAQGAGNALANAANESPTQAVTALRSSLKDALARAFEDANPNIAKSITGISSQLNSVIAKFAPIVAAALPGIIDKISAVLPAIGDAITKAFTVVTPILSEIVDLIGRASRFVADFFDQANTKGSTTQKILKDIRDVFNFIVTVIGDVATGFAAVADAVGNVLDKLTPVFSAIVSIAESNVGQKLLEVAGAIAAISLAGAGLGKVTESLVAIGKIAFGPAIAGITTIVTELVALATTAGLASLAEDVLIISTDFLTASIAGLSISIDTLLLSVGLLGAPFIAAAVAVAAIAAALVVAYFKVQAFHDAVDAVATFIKDVVITAFDLLVIAIRAPFDFLVGLVQSIIAYAEAIGGFIGGLLEKIPGVATAFDFVKTALDKVGGAFSEIGKIASKAFDAILNAIEAVLHALADAAGFGGVLNPFHGLAGDANDAAHKIQLLRDQINGLPDNKNVTVTVNADISAAEANLHQVLNDANATAAQIAAALDAVNASPGGNNLTGAISPTGRQAAATRDDNAARAAAAAAAAAAALRRSGGGGTSSSSGNSAANALKTATDNFKQALQSFLDAIGGAQTVAAVDAAFKSLQKAIDAEDKALGKKEPTGLKAYVAKQKKALEALAAQVESIQKAIDAAATETAAAISEANVVSAQAATAQATDLSALKIVADTTGRTLRDAAGNIHQLSAAFNTASTALSNVPASNSFVQALQAKAAALKQFVDDIAAARKAGLDPSLIQEFLSAGSGSDAQLKALLASGASSISAANHAQASIRTLAAQLGGEAAQASLAVGSAVVDGIVKGLQDKQKTLEKAMTNLADVLVARIKKDLKIKSPSQVMAAIGAHAAAGLHHGLLSGVAETARIAAMHAAAANPKIGSLESKLGTTAGQRELAIRLTGPSSNDTAKTHALLSDIAAATRGAPRTTIHAPVTQHIVGGAAEAHHDALASRLARLR